MRRLTFVVLALLGCQAPPPGATENSCGRGTLDVQGTCVLLGNAPGGEELSLRCGQGTELVAGLCTLTAEARGLDCGAGTGLVDGQCVANAVRDGEADAPQAPSDPRICGTGTALRDGVCVADLADVVTCGQGSTERDGQCVSNGLRCGAQTHERRGACVPDEARVTCGPGTTAELGVCVAGEVVTCGPGTVAEGGRCVPEAPSMVCGPGTEEAERQCVAADGIVTCGAGTVRDGGTCVVDEDWHPCGVGTVEVDGECERDESDPLAHTFELRIPVDVLPADGLSHIPLIAYGRNAWGEPSNAAIVVWADRPSAGTLRPGITTLERAGRRFWFIPCDAAVPGCAGPVRFHMARASDPDHILASTPELQVSALPNVSSMAPCMEGGSAFFTSGHADHPVVQSTKFLQRAAYETATIAVNGGPMGFVVHPDDHNDGARWEVTVDNSDPGAHLDGLLDMQLNGSTCEGGKYQIHAIDVDWRADGLGHVLGLQASWKVECRDERGVPYPTLVGCIRIDPADQEAFGGGNAGF